MNRWGSSLVAAGLLVAVASSTSAHAAGYGAGADLFRFDDARIVESSGIVASSIRDGVFFTHNDSGDSARFFAVDDQGCTLGTYSLPGVTATDIEDIARGPVSADDATSMLWLGDIGDNLHERAEIAVYRVTEPQSNASAHRESTGCDDVAAEEHEVTSTTFRLQYPDVAHDAETLLADPATGQLFIVTKAPSGESQLYAAPNPLVAGAVNVLTLETEIVYPPSATFAEPPEQVVNGDPTLNAIYASGRLWADGGDISPTRDRVVIRTYTDAFEWPIAPGQSLQEALLGIPTKIPLLYDPQGEAIAYTRDGRALVTTSEGTHSTAHIYELA